MGLITIFGPPAVGKMTVGQTIAKKTGYKLFHNHMSIDMLIPIFPFGSEEFETSITNIRNTVFEQAAKADPKEFKGLIFTVCWAFNIESDAKEIEVMNQFFKKENKETYFLELYADEATRLIRNRTENRLKHKVPKRDLEWSDKNLKEMGEKYILNSNGKILDNEHYLKINNSQLSPDEVAEMFISHFKIK